MEHVGEVLFSSRTWIQLSLTVCLGHVIIIKANVVDGYCAVIVLQSIETASIVYLHTV